MMIHYEFDNIECDVPYSACSHINNGWFEPHSEKRECTVEFDYYVSVGFIDILEFMKPMGFDKWSEDKKEGYAKAVRNMMDCGFIDVDTVEGDDDFIDFMKERYRDDALEECRSEE